MIVLILFRKNSFFTLFTHLSLTYIRIDNLPIIRRKERFALRGSEIRTGFGPPPGGRSGASPLRRRGAPRCRPSSSRWCSLLNQRGIQMAADAPGIQIEAINPRKAALELQPNVSRPAITRPSPARLPVCCSQPQKQILSLGPGNDQRRETFPLDNESANFDAIIALVSST